MQLRSVVWITVMALGLSCLGCTGASKKVVSQNQTLLSLKPVKGLIKKVAILQSPAPKSAIERQAGTLFFQSLTAAIREQAPTLQLVAPDDAGFPKFMTALASSVSSLNAEALAVAGRQGGFNGLIATALRDVRPMEEKSGVLWFRKSKYRLEFEVTLELYDPFTQAKMLSAVETGSVKISETVYEDYKAGIASRIESLDEALADLGEEIGELVADTLEAQPWQTAVMRVEGNKIYLSVGQKVGLQTGQRLAVVKGRRSIEGNRGEKFIVPGIKIGEIVITAISDQKAEAKADAPGKIEAGDIAIPVAR